MSRTHVAHEFMTGLEGLRTAFNGVPLLQQTRLAMDRMLQYLVVRVLMKYPAPVSMQPLGRVDDVHFKVGPGGDIVTCRLPEGVREALGLNQPDVVVELALGADDR